MREFASLEDCKHTAVLNAIKDSRVKDLQETFNVSSLLEWVQESRKYLKLEAEWRLAVDLLGEDAGDDSTLLNEA